VHVIVNRDVQSGRLEKAHGPRGMARRRQTVIGHQQHPLAAKIAREITHALQ